tara:strand:- start:51 stop:242 length:192 start_codon:yes stop_codon:yes gene_type:complete
MRKSGCDELVAFIPNQYAIAGKVLKLREDNGWTVLHVSKKAYTKSEVNSFRDAHRTTRAVSDV